MILQEVSEFIAEIDNDGAKSKWLTGSNMNVYIRSGLHSFTPGKLQKTIDIVTIQGSSEDSLNFIQEVHRLNPYYATCICNAGNSSSDLLLGGWIQSHIVGLQLFLPKDIDKYYNEIQMRQKFNV